MELSFIIPVFNCRETLEECVNSILEGQFSDYEILLADDGSTDGSGELCDFLAARHGPVRAIHIPHGGVSAARNAGLSIAQGRRILFVDGDDRVDVPGLREILGCQGNLLVFGHSGAPLPDTADPVALFRQELLVPLWNKVFRGDILRESGLKFREELFVYEDLVFVLEYLARCGGITPVPVLGYHCRPSGNAGKRMARLGSISEVLEPISQVISGGTEDILPILATILAREKLATSPGKILQICREYRRWCPSGSLLRLCWGALRLRRKRNLN